MKFKKHFEDPVIFPVKLQLNGIICSSQETGTDTGEGLGDDDQGDLN